MQHRTVSYKETHHLIRFHTKIMHTWSQNIHAYSGTVNVHYNIFYMDNEDYIVDVLYMTQNAHWNVTHCHLTIKSVQMGDNSQLVYLVEVPSRS